MEYIAFLFLGVGLLLVFAGLVLQAFDKKPPAWQKQESPTPPRPAPTEPTPLQTPPAATSSVPGPFQFLEEKAPPAEKPAPAPVAVSVAKENPRLFEKFAYLYLDSSTRNVYDGKGSMPAFDLAEVQGIRRFGRGVFSYDGFSFYFDHPGGQERFPLANLKTIGFYPNCVALTFRTNQPVALLFMEETESIRKVLETFRAEPAAAGG